MGDRKLMRTG